MYGLITGQIGVHMDLVRCRDSFPWSASNPSSCDKHTSGRSHRKKSGKDSGVVCIFWLTSVCVTHLTSPGLFGPMATAPDNPRSETVLENHARVTCIFICIFKVLQPIASSSLSTRLLSKSRWLISPSSPAAMMSSSRRTSSTQMHPPYH